MACSWSSVSAFQTSSLLIDEQHRHIARAQGGPAGGLVGEPAGLARTDRAGRPRPQERRELRRALADEADRPLGSSPPPYISGATMRTTTIATEMSGGDPERARAAPAGSTRDGSPATCAASAVHAPRPSETASRNRSRERGRLEAEAVTSPARRALARISSRSTEASTSTRNRPSCLLVTVPAGRTGTHGSPFTVTSSERWGEAAFSSSTTPASTILPWSMITTSWHTSSTRSSWWLEKTHGDAGRGGLHEQLGQRLDPERIQPAERLVEHERAPGRARARRPAGRAAGSRGRAPPGARPPGRPGRGARASRRPPPSPPSRHPGQLGEVRRAGPRPSSSGRARVPPACSRSGPAPRGRRAAPSSAPRPGRARPARRSRASWWSCRRRSGRGTRRSGPGDAERAPSSATTSPKRLVQVADLEHRIPLVRLTLPS